MPEIGTRVKYHRPATQHIEARECTGTVMAHYRGGDKCEDKETGETWITSDHVGIKVDSIPEWWPYNGSDRFAPSIEELVAIKGVENVSDKQPLTMAE